MSIEELSDQQQVRRDKLNALREEGYPFPNDVRLTSCAAGARATATEQNALEVSERRVDTVAGRVMQIRLMGKAAFCHIQDISGKLQVYVKRDEVGEEAFAKFKKFDLGDIVEVKGYGFLTKTDEPSLHATAIRLLVKCLHPLPEKFHGLTDIEIRYRQRYLDLIMNPEVKKTFLARSKIIATMRKFFNERLFVEVETPVLNTAASGAAAKPFRTHHNALDMDLSLRIAPELSLKKLVVGGIERVYEIGRVFRNEGISTQHNPEFTMIEFYQAYATYEDLMELTEELLTLLCKEVTGGLQIEYEGQKVDFARPWQRLSMVDAIYQLGGISRDVDLLSLEGIHQAAKTLGIKSALDTSDYGMAVYLVFDEAIECKIVNPTFITRHPLSVSPLARPAMDDGRFTDRFELMICGMEVANGFSELNDADDQRARMDVQLVMKEKGDEEAMELDEDFLKALEYGLPPTAGEGIGVDRLVMLLTQSPSIRDVILFPTLRPL